MIHIVYRITNNITSQYYIGIHSTKKLNDGYMGSGHLIKKAIKKHGIENFRKEILYRFDSREQALIMEEYLVNEKTLKDELCYNLIFGGKGIRTIEERRKQFGLKNKGETSTNNTYKRWNDKSYHRFYLREDFTLKCDDKLTQSILNILTPKTTIELLTEMYNRDDLHEWAEKHLNLIKDTPGYWCNIVHSIEDWPNGGK